MYYLVLPECVCTPWDERPDFVPACKIGCCQAGFVWNTMCWKPLDWPSEVISWSQEPNYGCQSQSYQPHMLQSYSCSISRGISLVMYHKLYIIQRTISNYWSVSIRKDEKGLISSQLARDRNGCCWEGFVCNTTCWNDLHKTPWLAFRKYQYRKRVQTWKGEH